MVFSHTAAPWSEKFREKANSEMTYEMSARQGSRATRRNALDENLFMGRACQDQWVGASVDLLCNRFMQTID